MFKNSGSVYVAFWQCTVCTVCSYPSECRHLGDEHAGREPEGVTVAAAVGELQQLWGEDKVPAQLRQVDREGGEAAAGLPRLTRRLPS